MGVGAGALVLGGLVVRIRRMVPAQPAKESGLGPFLWGFFRLGWTLVNEGPFAAHLQRKLPFRIRPHCGP